MLKGEKVTLRPLTRDDMQRLCEFTNDIEFELAGGGDPPKPHTLEEWQTYFDDKIAKGSGENAEFGIEAGGKLIGFCGLHHFDATARACELGIGIGEKDYWGKGYGREAVRLLLDYAFRLRNMRRVWLNTQGNNERAIRCYRACGFVEEGRLREHAWSNGRYHDVVYMGMLRAEWPPEEAQR